jgi:hypothetical protein
MERLFAGRESGTDAIDQKIVKAERRDMRQESSAKEATGGSREGNAATTSVRDIQAERALPPALPSMMNFRVRQNMPTKAR